MGAAVRRLSLAGLGWAPRPFRDLLFVSQKRRQNAPPAESLKFLLLAKTLSVLL